MPRTKRHGRAGRTAVVAGVLASLVSLLCGAHLPASAQTTLDAWPQFQHDSQHTGISTDTAINASTAKGLPQAWKAGVGGGNYGHAPVWASPVVAYDANLGKAVVYVATTGAPAVLRAVDAQTGTVIWSFSVSQGSIYTTPLVVDDTVY